MRSPDLLHGRGRERLRSLCEAVPPASSGRRAGWTSHWPRQPLLTPDLAAQMFVSWWPTEVSVTEPLTNRKALSVQQERRGRHMPLSTPPVACCHPKPTSEGPEIKYVTARTFIQRTPNTAREMARIPSPGTPGTPSRFWARDCLLSIAFGRHTRPPAHPPCCVTVPRFPGSLGCKVLVGECPPQARLTAPSESPGTPLPPHCSPERLSLFRDKSFSPLGRAPETANPAKPEQADL